MMRRSFGTRTMTGLNEWLYRTFVRARSVEADLADFHTGTAIKVYCATYDLGTPRTIVTSRGVIPGRKGGYLVLTAGQPVFWETLTKTEHVAVTALGPLTASINTSRPPALKRLGVYVVDMPEGQYSIYIPTLDVSLVNAALASATAPA